MIFPHIETYLEFIGGHRDAQGKQTFSWMNPNRIKLATYDVNFIDSVTEQTMRNVGLTDKQAFLAEKLIATYEKQLKKLGIDQPDHKNYRLGIRTINRSKCLTLVDNKLHMRFPFDEDLINEIKLFAKTSQGIVFWDHENKVWSFANTEYNLSWAVMLAQSNGMQVDAEVMELFNLILEAEQTPYAIELKYGDDGCYIENAPSSMVEYLEANGGFDDIYKLVDYSGALGYTVSEEISQLMQTELGSPFMKLCADRAINMTPSTGACKMEDILEWAIAVDRTPIVVYNPNFLKVDMTVFEKYFKPEEIQTISLKGDPTLPIVVDPVAQIVYTNKVLPDWQGRMPLLITYANLMHGANKRRFLVCAEKVVYYCSPLPGR